MFAGPGWVEGATLAAFAWAGVIGASGWPVVGMGSKKVEAECVFAGLGLVGAVCWAAFGRAGVIGEAGWPFAGLDLVAAVF